jgi:hypothetical protein
MVNISTTGDNLVFEVLGSHKLWSLTSRLEIPAGHVKAVYADPRPAMGWFQGLKVAGTDLPHIFRAGVFWQDGDKVFWDVRHPKNTIVIEFAEEGFSKLIIEVHDPAEAVNAIKEAVSAFLCARDKAEAELEEFMGRSAAGDHQLAGSTDPAEDPLRA